jgi:hypothetical protein
MPAPVNIVGQRFGRLTVLGLSHSGSHNRYWLCRCDCGTEIRATTGNLRGTTHSCGCLYRDTRGLRLRHGHAVGEKPSSAYSRWANMKNRCLNPRADRWDDYGGRGIKVCARWMIFDNFYADMGDPPPGLTLDRRNNDGHYEPDNCYWATRREQRQNQRQPRH